MTARVDLVKADIQAALSFPLFNTSVGIFLSPKEISDSLIVKSYTVPEPLIFFQVGGQKAQSDKCLCLILMIIVISIVNVQEIVPIFNISQDTSLHIFTSLLTSVTHCKEAERS